MRALPERQGEQAEEQVGLGVVATSAAWAQRHAQADIAVPLYCGADAKQLEAFDNEVIDRLFALNELRAAQDQLDAAPQ